MTSTNRPPVFSDRYELVRHIARGGMAQVYLAKDLLLDRSVALKVLFPELSVDQSFVRRFRREAQAAASLSHPNIVSIYDWGQGEQTYCIVMEYVDGRTLSAMVRQAPLEARQAATIGAHVAAALDYAHGHGVIHRDVKPGNVLIDNSGQVKVADFGIARAVGTTEGLTQTGAVMGTATYFSPEQAQGYPVDARSDVYSLGVVLYEIVAGRAPFTGDNPVSIAYKHVREVAVPLREIKPSVPEDYEAIVAKAMAKSADDRYQSAGELEADLDRFIAGQPVMAAAYLGATTMAPAANVDDTRMQTTALPRTLVAGAGGVGGLGAEDGEEGAGDEAPSRTGRYVALLIALLVVLAVLVFFLGRSLGWWDSAPTRTIPTNVVGQPAAAVVTELNQAGFSHTAQATEQSATVAAGDVVTTRPTPGSRVKTDQTVTLEVSSGPKMVAVPDVTNKPQAQATSLLMGAGFKVNVTPQPSDTVTSGLVIATKPAARVQTGQGSLVTIVVSSGKAQVVIPPVTGENQITASNTLGAKGLGVNVSSEPSPTVNAGDVIGTNPPVGSPVSNGSTVTLYVSTGPAMVNVPDLSGKTQAQAAALLQSAGLTGNFSMTRVTSASEDGMVVGQNPSSGASATSGSAVAVSIGQYTAPATTTTSTTTTSTIPSVTTTRTTKGGPAN